MSFTDSYLSEISKQLPELPNEKVERYMKDYKVRYEDAYIITRNTETAKYFEAVTSKMKDSGQSIANYIINKKISIDIPVEEFVKKAGELLKPKETDLGALKESIEKAIAGNPNVVADYKSGKQNAAMFLVGQVMREMKGKADAKIVRDEIIKKLSDV